MTIKHVSRLDVIIGTVALSFALAACGASDDSAPSIAK